MKGPRKFNIVIPGISNSKYIDFEQISGTKEKGLLKAWKAKDKTAIGLINNPPQWSEGYLTRS